MNTLPSHLEGVSTVMFVDDTTLYVIGHFTTDISIKLSCALDTAHKWLLECGKDCHQRSCHPLKFISMVPHLTGSELLIPIGVVISDTLSWNQHIDIVCSKADEGDWPPPLIVMHLT